MHTPTLFFGCSPDCPLLASLLLAGATTNGNGHGGNGNGNGVTSKQHGEAAPPPTQLPKSLSTQPADPQPQQPVVVTVGAAAVAAAPPTFETRPQEVRKALAAIEAASAAFDVRRKPEARADAATTHREQQRQLLLRQIKAEEEEEAERRGAVEVAEVAEALTSLRDSGSPRHRPLSPAAQIAAHPGAAGAAAGMLTRAAAAAAAKGFRPLPPESFTAGSVDTQHLFAHGQHLLLQRQGGSEAQFSPPPPQQAAAPAPQPSPQQGGASLASSPPAAQQQAAQQSQQAPQQAQQHPQPMMPPFPGMMPFGEQCGVLLVRLPWIQPRPWACLLAVYLHPKHLCQASPASRLLIAAPPILSLQAPCLPSCRPTALAGPTRSSLRSRRSSSCSRRLPA